MNQPVGGLDDICPTCGAEVGDHTIRDWPKCLDAQGRNYRMPFTEIPGGPIMLPGLGEMIPAGGFHVKSGMIEAVIGKVPLLAMQFDLLTETGPTPSPEYALVLSPAGMREAKELLNKNINAAIRAAEG